MAINPQRKQATSGVSQEYDLLTSTEQYMRNEISIDQLGDIQHLCAQNLKAVALKLAEVEQSNQAHLPTKNATILTHLLAHLPNIFAKEEEI